MFSRAIFAAALCAVTAAPAYAYTIRTTSKGVPLRWPTGNVPVVIALSDVPSGVSVEDAEDAALAAFGTYGEILDAAGNKVVVQVTTTDGTVDVNNRDGQNVIRWIKSSWAELYDPGALAVTLTSYDAGNGRITDADIVINAQDYVWTAKASLLDCQNAYDLQNVLTHEAGHLFGLGHDKTDTEATMYPSSGTCESKKRDLDSGDMTAMEVLYLDTASPSGPSGAAALGCSTTGGQSGGLFGALLVAAVLFGRRFRRAGVLLGLGALVIPSVGQATTVRRLSLDDLSRGSVVVARGVVGAQTGVVVDGHVFTDATLIVSECLKGDCGTTLTIRQLGGEVDGAGFHVEGNAELPPAGEVVLMLRRRADGTYAPLGMAQGAFHVERDVTTLAIRALHRDASKLRYAKPEGGDVQGTVDSVSLDDLRASIARTSSPR